MRRNLRRLVHAALALAVMPSLAQAQLLVSTGASTTNGLDNRWQVSTNPSAATPTWAAASIVTNVPGQWTASAPGGTWVSSSPTGSGGGGNYAIRTLFTLATGDLFTATFRCAFDNNAPSLWINGSQVNIQNPCGGNVWAWGATQTLTQSLFTTGQNVLEFRWTGDNTTDGMAVQIQSLSFTPGTQPPVPGVVPEPTSVVLMGTGLFALGVVARRRRERGTRTPLA